MTVQMCLNPKDQEKIRRVQILINVVFAYSHMKRTWSWVSVLNGSSVPVNAGFMKTVLLTVSWTAVAKRGYAPSVLS